MKLETEDLNLSISELNVVSNNNKIRVVNDNELAFVAGGAVAVMGATLFGSTYTQHTSLVGYSY